MDTTNYPLLTITSQSTSSQMITSDGIRSRVRRKRKLSDPCDSDSIEFTIAILSPNFDSHKNGRFLAYALRFICFTTRYKKEKKRLEKYIYYRQSGEEALGETIMVMVMVMVFIYRIFYMYIIKCGLHLTTQPLNHEIAQRPDQHTGNSTPYSLR